MLHHSPFSTTLGIVFSPPGNQWGYVSFACFWPNAALRWLEGSKTPIINVFPLIAALLLHLILYDMPMLHLMTSHYWCYDLETEPLA